MTRALYPNAMASKFAQFLTDNKIDSRRLLVTSKEIERLRREDRARKLATRQAKAAGKTETKPAEGEAKPAKRHSGRPVTRQLVQAASAGKRISGPAKTRLLRALNQVLTTKKQNAVELRAIF